MENQEKIEAYLTGTLTGTALKQFEAELLTNEALAQEVGIQSDMNQYLSSNPKKDALRDSLTQLSNNYETKPNGFDWNTWLPLIGLVGLIGASIWYANNLKHPGQSIPDLEIPVVQPIIKKETPTIQESIEIEEPVAPKIETTQKPVPKKETQFLPKPKKVEPKKPSQPIAAADFAPNPALDAFLDNNVRSGDFDFEINKVNDLNIKDNEVALSYQGQLKTDEDLSEYAFIVHLFSNKKADYENFQSIKSWDVGFTEFSEDTEQFKIEALMELEAGRYYWYLEDADSGIIYDVQTFKVQ